MGMPVSMVVAVTMAMPMVGVSVSARAVSNASMMLLAVMPAVLIVSMFLMTHLHYLLSDPRCITYE
jgi:hypothetical protein